MAVSLKQKPLVVGASVSLSVGKNWNRVFSFWLLYEMGQVWAEQPLLEEDIFEE